MPYCRFFDLLCPRPGCGSQISYIDFQLELGDPALYVKGMIVWGNGPGLIGPCPGCRNPVLFSLNGKSCVAGDAVPQDAVRLPDDWFEHALLLAKAGKMISF